MVLYIATDFIFVYSIHTEKETGNNKYDESGDGTIPPLPGVGNEDKGNSNP